VTGTATGEWIHGGRFLRQTWAIERGTGLPPMSGSTIMTYDPRQRAYRSWSFFSTGFTIESRGTWDAKSRTMSWTGQDAESGRSMVIRATFAPDGTETWGIVEKDKGGKVVSESSGRNTRRKG
jgi:hypothetical protein